MSHEFESGFFVRERAWHGLGTVLDGAPGVEEAIVAAGLDWRVVRCPVSWEDAGGYHVIPDRRAFVRSSDGSCLAVLSNKFAPLQNRKAFEWVQPWVDSGEIRLEAAGALREGRVVWILAQIADGDVPGAADRVRAFLLLSNSHDGSQALRIEVTPVRVVCMNTLAMATQDGAHEAIRILHRGDPVAMLDIARGYVDLQRRRLTAFGELTEILAARRFTLTDAREYFYSVLGISTAEQVRSSRRRLDRLEHLFAHGKGNRGRSAWDAYGAVTEWVSHDRGGEETRTAANWFGEGARIRERAWDLAVEAAGV